MKDGKKKLTIIYHASKDGMYVGWISEKPSVISQSETLHGLLENLGDALRVITEYEKN